MSTSATHDRAESGSDLKQADVDEQAPKKASGQILRQEITEGMDALDRPVVGLFVSGLSAGLDIGFSLFLMAVMLTHAKGSLPKPVVELLVANTAAVGFIFVILGRSELFTEQTTDDFKVLNADDPNLTGAAAFAGLIARVGPDLGVIQPWAFGEIAHRLTDHPAHAIFPGGLLAGWLMGLVSWLVAASRDTISQIVLVWIVATAIAFANLHHAVLGSVEVLAGAFSGQGIGPADVGRFQLWTTLGNTVGGVVFVAFLKYGQARPAAQSASAGDR